MNRFITGLLFAAALFAGVSAHAATGVMSGGRGLAGQVNNVGPAVLGTCNLLANKPGFYNANYTYPDPDGGAVLVGQDAQEVAFTDFLLYCQRKAIDIGAQTFASTHIPYCIEVTATASAFQYNTSSPVVWPRYVCPAKVTSFVRDGDGLTGNTLNWNGDPRINALDTKQRPLFYFPAGGTMASGSKLVGNLNRSGTDRGSGLVYGMTWAVGSATLKSTGTAVPIGGGTIACTIRNPDTVPPASGPSITFSVAAGVATGVTSPSGGNYSRYGQGSSNQFMLPPWQLRRQATVAHGWDGHDSRHPRVFEDDANGDYDYRTVCSGTDYGITVAVKWQPEWCDGAAADADSVTCTARTDGPLGTNSPYWAFSNGTSVNGYLDEVYMEQSGQSYDASLGYTFGVWIDSFETVVNYVQTHGSFFGLIGHGADLVVVQHNDVGSAIQAVLRGGAGLHILYAREDTPVDSISNDAHAIHIDHCSDCSVDMGDVFFNANASTTTIGAMVRLGSDAVGPTPISDATHMNSGVRVGPLTLTSDSSSAQTLTAFSIAYTQASVVTGYVSNLGINGSARSSQITKFLSFGTNAQASNSARGSMDNVGATTSIFTGTIPAMNMDIWDGTCKYLAGGLCEITGSGAPSSGTTADNKAPGGSRYWRSNGEGYVNSGTTADSVWTKFTP